MNPTKFGPCVEEIRRYVADRDEIGTAIVYGSVAVGTARVDSDLDLFLIAPRRRHERLAREMYRIGARDDVTVSPYLVDPDDLKDLDMQFVESVARDGIVLKGEGLDPTIRRLGLEPCHLITLHMEHLSQKDKVRLSRALYGYESVRTYKDREYRSRKRGFVEQAGGWKLGRGTVLIPSGAWPNAEALLRKYGVKRWAFTVWVQRATSKGLTLDDATREALRA